MRSILDTHDLQRDTRLADSGIVKLAAMLGALSSLASDASIGAAWPRRQADESTGSKLAAKRAQDAA